MLEPLLSKLKELNLDHNIYYMHAGECGSTITWLVLNCTSSETSPVHVTSDVPKGSILGLIPFSFSYINDIVKTMESSLVLYTNDTVRSVPERTTAYYKRISISDSLLSNWATANLMTFNISKYKYCIAGNFRGVQISFCAISS